MDKHTVIKAVVADSNTTQISFLEVCEHYAISEDMLLELLEYGLISDISNPNRELRFNQKHLQRILSAHRLHQDLNVNTHGAILALELMDELTELRRQMDIIRRHLG